jgi:hypothetical protein
MQMKGKLILTAILALAASFNSFAAQDCELTDKSLAAAEATYARSAVVFQQMREMRK